MPRCRLTNYVNFLLIMCPEIRAAFAATPENDFAKQTVTAHEIRSLPRPHPR